jgi:hypothetical protein
MASREKTARHTYFGTYHWQVNSGPQPVFVIPRQLSFTPRVGYSSVATLLFSPVHDALPDDHGFDAFRVYNPDPQESLGVGSMAQLYPHLCTNERHLGGNSNVQCDKPFSNQQAPAMSIFAAILQKVLAVHWGSRCFILRGHIAFA